MPSESTRATLTTLAIVTGASRGLGQALVAALLADGARVIGMARGKMGHDGNGNFTPCTVDLSDTTAAVLALKSALADLDGRNFAGVTLINNAGTLAPISLADQLPPATVAEAVAVNLAAPIALTSAFLRITSAWPGARRIINLSSGAASTAYEGWSVYCATKAGVDQFSRCVALEQHQSPHPNPARIVSLAPGVIDTDMQAQIRATPAANFPNRQRFVDLKSKGELQPPQAAAHRILSYLDHPDFGREAVVDIRQL